MFRGNTVPGQERSWRSNGPVISRALMANRTARFSLFVLRFAAGDVPFAGTGSHGNRFFAVARADVSAQRVV